MGFGKTKVAFSSSRNLLLEIVEPEKEKPTKLFLPRLLPEEQHFQDLVKRRDLTGVKDFLKNNAKFNINCLNYKGETGLGLAVENGDEDMVMTLLEVKDVEVGDCLLRAIKQDRLPVALLILRWLDSRSPGLETLPVPDSLVFADCVTPLVLAAACDNHDAVTLLLSRGHTIPAIHPPTCLCQALCQPMLKSEDRLKGALRKLKTYEALSSEAYICHTSPHPILTAFELSTQLKEAAKFETVFGKKYSALARKTRLFAANLVGKCRTLEEVRLILSERRGFRDTTKSVMYPRLLMAIATGQKEFVSHPNVQQMVEEIWAGDWEEWRGYSRRRKLGEILLRALVLPSAILCLIFTPGSRRAQHYALPINKMLNHVIAYAIFLFFIFLQSDIDKAGQTRVTRFTAIEYVLMVYLLAYVCNTVRLCYIQSSKRFFGWKWNLVEVTMETTFVLSFIFRGLAIFNTALTGEVSLERKYWHRFDPQLIAEGLFLVGTVMAYLKVLLVCQVNYDIGPFQVSLGKMCKDCAKFSIMVSIIMLAFTVGLSTFYSYYVDMVQTVPNTGVTFRQDRSWVSLLDTLKILFWGLFGMSSYSAADVVIENLPDKNGQPTIINTHDFTEDIGYLTFAVYMILSVIVILNMLIAAMSNTFLSVTNNLNTEWLFGRTQVYLQYMNQTALPPPFNLVLSSRYGITNCSQPERKDVEKATEDSSTAYKVLMAQLVQRYLSSKSASEKEL